MTTYIASVSVLLVSQLAEKKLLDNGDLKEQFDLRFQMADSTPIWRIGPLNLAEELFSVFSIRKSGLIVEIQSMGWLYYPKYVQ